MVSEKRLSVLVDEQTVESIKETHPHGTISREVRSLLESIESGADYQPQTEAKAVEEKYKERIHSDDYPSDWDARRKEVFQRDNYQCQNCLNQGGRDSPHELIAHHIVPVESDRGTNRLSNLVTLCNSCHDNTHY